MKINKTVTVAIVLVGLLLGGLAAGAFFGPKPMNVSAAPPAQQGENQEMNEANDNETGGEVNDVNETADSETADTNEAAEPQSGNEANEVKEGNDTQESGEANDGAALQGQATLTMDEAKAVAEKANPGAKAVDAELDQMNETNGPVVYDVELDNGSEVLIDANTGEILPAPAGEKD